MTKRVGLRPDGKRQTCLINDRRWLRHGLHGLVRMHTTFVFVTVCLLFVLLTRLLLFHSRHWPILQSLSSKSVQTQMPIEMYSNSTILTALASLITQLSDGEGATGGQ